MRIPAPSPAMVVAVIALVMSTAGATIAATGSQVPLQSVGAGQLRTGSVTGAKIRDRSITIRDLALRTTAVLRRPSGVAGGALGGSYPNPTLAPGVVTPAALADGAITAAKLADGSISGSKVMSGSIDASDLVPNEAWRIPGAAGEPALGSMWGSSSTGLYERASFRKDRFGVVHLRGIAFKSSDMGGSILFTLPVGYRPLKHRTWIVPSGTGYATLGPIDVESGGDVWVFAQLDDRNVSLDGISFVAGE